MYGTWRKFGVAGPVAIVLTGFCFLAAAQVPDPANVDSGAKSAEVIAQGPNEVYLYHVKVAGRRLDAVNYFNGSGTTDVRFVGTDLMPDAHGEAKIRSVEGKTGISARVEGLTPAIGLWAISSDGHPQNLGEFKLAGNKASMEVSSSFQAFGMIVTAEPYDAVSQLSDVAVLKNAITDKTNGVLQQAAQSQLQTQESQERAANAQAQADNAAAAQAQAEAAKAKADAEAASARTQVNEAQQEAAATREKLRAQLNAVLATTESARGLIVNLGDVLFNTAQITLKQPAQIALAKIATILQLYPGLHVQVECYTDSVGSDAYNQKLSENRANVVRDFLIQNGVPAANVTAVGYGKADPMADNGRAAGHALNHRVNLVVSGQAIGVKTSHPKDTTTPASAPQ